MADEKDDAQKEILRRAQEEQERLESQEEERRLTAEARKEYEDSKKMIEEYVRSTKQSFEQMAKDHKEALKKAQEEATRRFNQEWQRSFDGWISTASGAIREVMMRSMRRSIDSTNVGDLSPGLGQTGRQLGAMFGGAMGGAIGTWFGGPEGAILGKKIGAVAGGFLTDATAMQAEGYNMMGARVTRVFGAGRDTSTDFEEVGRKYRLAVRDVVRGTGETAEVAGRSFEQLSRVGIGYKEGQKDLAQYALSLDRVLNLQPGRTLKVETDLVTRYGESAVRTRALTRDLIDTVADFNVEQARTGNALTATFASGNTLAGTLDQIASAARNSGASLEAMNGMAISVVKTMATGANAGMMRPEQIAASGGRVLQGLMPSSQSSPGAEAKRSGIDRMLLEQSHSGKDLIGRIEKEGDQFGMGSRERSMMMESLATVHFSRGGPGRGEAYRWMGGMLEGMDKARKHGDTDTTMKAWSMFQDRGFSGTDMLMMRKLSEEFERAGAFAPGHDPAKVMKHVMDAKEQDPQYRETVGKMRAFMGEAKKQGDAAASTLDKISDTMTGMSVWFNEGYWTKGRDAIAQAFGLGPKPGILKMLGGMLLGTGPKSGSMNEGAAAALGITPSMMGMQKKEQGTGSPSATTNMSRSEMNVSPQTQNQMSMDRTRNQSGLEQTGGN